MSKSTGCIILHAGLESNSPPLHPLKRCRLVRMSTTESPASGWKEKGRETAEEIVVETPLQPPQPPRDAEDTRQTHQRGPVQIPETPSSPKGLRAESSPSSLLRIQSQSQSQSQSHLTISDESPLNPARAIALRRHRNGRAVVPDSQPDDALVQTQSASMSTEASNVQPTSTSTPEDEEMPQDIGSEEFAELVRVWESPSPSPSPPPSPSLSSKRPPDDGDKSSRSSSATLTESPRRNRKRPRLENWEAREDDDSDNRASESENVSSNTSNRVAKALARNNTPLQPIEEEHRRPFTPQATATTITRKPRVPLIVSQSNLPRRRFTDSNPRTLRTFWTEEETAALKEMIMRFGPHWSLIKQKDDESSADARRLARRNAGNLKDKARQMAAEYYR